MASDLLPVCPKCGDLSPPGWRVCETCGSYLMLDDAQRDLLVRLEYARQQRYPQALSPPVDDRLLDTEHADDVPSPRDTASGVGGADLVLPLAADPDHPSRLVDRGSA